MTHKPRHTPERAARWLRVSSGQQDEKNQEPSEDKWIASHGYLHVKDYVLHGKSAYKGHQDEKLDEVIRDMQDHMVDVLIVWQSSRIERRGAYNVFDLARRVRQAGGRVEFTEDSYLNESNEMSDVMLAMVATKDNLDSRDRSKKTLMTHQRIRTNKAFLGRPPYGWRVEGEKYSKHPVPCEPEAAVLREASDRYLDRGETLWEICEAFNADPVKYPPPRFKGRDSKWYPKTLSDLFRNPATAGRWMWTFTVGEGNDAVRERVTIAETEGIFTWPEHGQLAARLDSRAHRAGISPSNVFLQTGLLFDEHGHPMWGKRDKVTYGYYYCRERGCGTSLRQDKADAELVRQVIEEYADEPHEIRRVVPGENYLDEIARKKQDISELNAEAEGYLERVTAMVAELAELRARPTKPDHVEWVKTGKTVAEHWESLDIAGRRDWLRERGVKVTAVVRHSRWKLTVDWWGHKLHIKAAVDGDGNLASWRRIPLA